MEENISELLKNNGVDVDDLTNMYMEIFKLNPKFLSLIEPIETLYSLNLDNMRNIFLYAIFRYSGDSDERFPYCVLLLSESLAENNHKTKLPLLNIVNFVCKTYNGNIVNSGDDKFNDDVNSVLGDVMTMDLKTQIGNYFSSGKKSLL